jgi:hypothetical protein
MRDARQRKERQSPTPKYWAVEHTAESWTQHVLAQTGRMKTLSPTNGVIAP